MRADSLHVSTSTVRELLRDTHERGIGCWAVDVAGRSFEFSVGAVRDVTVDTEILRGSGRRAAEALPLRAATPVVFNYRDASTFGDPGRNGFALVRAALLFEVPRHRGAVPSHLVNHYRVDTTATRSSDIEIHGADLEDVAWLSEVIATLVQNHYGGTHPFPHDLGADLLPDGPIKVLTRNEPWPQVILVSAETGDDDDEIPVLALDATDGPRWVARVSARTLAPELEKLQHAVRGFSQKAGFVEAATHARLRDGHIEISADPPRETDTEPTVNPEILRLAPSAPGEDPTTVRLSPLDADQERASAMREDVARVAETLLTIALSGPSAPRNVEWARTVADPSALSARPLHLEIREGGVMLHGALDRRRQPTAVVAEFAILRSPLTQRRFTFDSSQSWAPGSELARLEWDFGDGTTASSTGVELALVEQHEYSADGDYEVKLVVTDARERRASLSAIASVGRLHLDVSPPMLVESGIVTALRVTSGNAPVTGAEVTISAVHDDVSLTTDDEGMALLEGAWTVIPEQSDGLGIQLGTAASVTVVNDLGRGTWPCYALTRETVETSVECAMLCDSLLARTEANAAADQVLVPEVLRETKASLLAGRVPHVLAARGSEESRLLSNVREWLDSTAAMLPHPRDDDVDLIPKFGSVPIEPKSQALD